MNLRHGSPQPPDRRNVRLGRRLDAARLRRRPSGLLERMLPRLAPVTGVYLEKARPKGARPPESLAALSRALGRAPDFSARTRRLA